MLERPPNVPAEKIRELIKQTIPSGVPIIVRIARNHIEVGTQSGDAADRLRSAGFSVITRSEECLPGLIEKERFWEAHEFLEAFWRSSPANRKNVEIVIKLLAALVKIQEGFPRFSMKIVTTFPPNVREKASKIAERYSRGENIRDEIFDLINELIGDPYSFCKGK